MSLALKVTFFLPVVPMATERRFEARMAAMRSWSLAERTFTLCLQAIFLLSVPPPPFEATAALAAELPKSDLATGLLPRHDEEDSDESDDEAAEMEESDDELELFLSAELGVFWSEFVSVESLEEPSPSEPSLLSTTSFLPLAATALPPPVPQLFVGARVLLVEVLRTLLSFRSVVAVPVDAIELEICLGAGSGARLAAAAAADAAAASSALRLAC